MALTPPRVQKNVSDTIDLSEVAVPSTYNGARLIDDRVTLEFVQQLVADFKEGHVLHRRYALAILLQIKALLQQLPTLVSIPVLPGTHITVCGDVHGQWYDLMNIFALNGMPSEENRYLFNGTLAAPPMPARAHPATCRRFCGPRLVFSGGDLHAVCAQVPVPHRHVLHFLYFLCLILMPAGIYLTRGNHETKAMNSLYGFEGEVRAKYNETMVKLFACAPLQALLSLVPLSLTCSGRFFDACRSALCSRIKSSSSMAACFREMMSL
jgi:serine/threonine-protein phosphatase 5